MKLFDQKKRTDLKPANHLDDDYDFYDRSAQPMFAKIRNLLNKWFDHYPQEDQLSLKTDFKNDFQAAFFELFIHELFKKQGFKLKPHPKVEGTTKKPDFLVTSESDEFYIEVKHASDLSEQANSHEKRKALLYDEINKIESPDFFLHIRELSIKTDQQPSAKKVIQVINNELLMHNPDKVTQLVNEYGLDNTPRINFEDEKIEIEISIIPKSPESRGKKGIRPIGMYPGEFSWGGAENAIKKAIENKATRYGNLNLPYLVCINSTSRKWTDDEDVMNALFGSLQVTVSTDPSNEKEKWSRAYDGVFLDTTGPKFTRVSGILITNVYPSNLHVANHWLVKHPFASNDLNFDDIYLSRIEVIENKIESISGKRINEILKVPDDWFSL
jgi:hypothetical protein